MADWRSQPRQTFGLRAENDRRNCIPSNHRGAHSSANLRQTAPRRYLRTGYNRRNKREQSPETIPSARIKYPIGSDVDRQILFDFPFLVDEDTTSFVEEHGQIMFIVRGLPSTGKATLSEMLSEQYSSAVLCCADHYFDNTFSTRQRTRENMRASHEFCRKKVQQACEQGASPIIVQNTHIRKWEMQVYLDFAVKYNYVVVMAITHYRYDVTAEALARYNPDGLNYDYMKHRLAQWENILPILTGWFISPKDTAYLLNSLLISLNAMTDDGKFCRIFDIYDTDGILNYFKPRKLLYCLAGYTDNTREMKKYYFSDEVQDNYGKCFTITIQGYIVSLSGVTSIVSITEEMEHLTLNSENDIRADCDDISNQLNSLTCIDLSDYGETTTFQSENLELENDLVLEEWKDEENIDIKNCTFIHMAQKEGEVFNTKKLKNNFKVSLASLSGTDCGYTEMSKMCVCRLVNNEWFVKVPQKIKVKGIFTGLYV